MIEYRSYRRLVVFTLFSFVYSLVALASVDGFAVFQIWMFGLVASLWLPPFFVACAVRLSREGNIEIRYPLRRRHIDVATVRSIELTFGFPRRLKIRFLRGRLLLMRDDS